MMNVELTDDLYVRFRDLLYTRAGLDYPERKRADLAHSLNLALRASGLPDLETLYTNITASGAAWDMLVTNVTIGETYFFRNAPQFAALREHILPDVLARRATTRGVRLWSAGCATGEEPYSLAMTLCDMVPDRNTWQFSILASDINPDFLARAEAGLYGSWSFRETPAAMQTRFFTPDGPRWRLQTEIRRMVRFMRLNLAEATYPAITNGTCALDIILCRNVTIYFDTATTRQVISRLYQALVPGGWLIVGHAEPQAGVYDQFEVHNFPDTVVYRKPLNAPLFAFDSASGTFSAGAAPLLTPGSRTVAPPPTPQPPAARITLPQSPSPRPEPPRAAAEPPREPDAVEIVRQARQCADRGDWAAAEQHCTRALERDALCRNAHYLLGQIHEHENRLDAALAAYRRTVYLDRNFVLGTIGMAHVWRAMGRNLDAQRCYRNALRQLAAQPPTAAVPDGDGLTYADLASIATRQIQVLETAA